MQTGTVVVAKTAGAGVCAGVCAGVGAGVGAGLEAGAAQSRRGGGGSDMCVFVREGGTGGQWHVYALL